MAKSETASTRAPRGTKPVSQAFFAALDAIPEASRAAVAKAAQAMIRDEIKSHREKVKAASAKDKARKPASRAKTVPAAAPKSAKNSPVAKSGAAAASPPAKRRAPKQTGVAPAA